MIENSRCTSKSPRWSTELILKRPNGRKNDFFQTFFLLHIFTSRQNFLFDQNFTSSAVQRFHGGQKGVTSTNKQTTNKQTNKRTPQTIRIPRQDLKDPRANICKLESSISINIDSRY